MVTAIPLYSNFPSEKCAWKQTDNGLAHCLARVNTPVSYPEAINLQDLGAMRGTCGHDQTSRMCPVVLLVALFLQVLQKLVFDVFGNDA